MTNKEQIREVVALILILMIIVIPTVVVFFSDGGEIRGITERSRPIGENRTVQVDGLTFVPVHEEIQPIYDDDPVIACELWELPPRDILMILITYPFTYIPPSVVKILSLLYLASGLAFLMFCRRETGRNDPDPNSRRELINRYIREHPGKNTQQIADALGISRSSLTYYLHQLEAAGSILSVRYGGQQHFLPANIGLNEHQKKPPSPSFQGKRSSVLSDTPVSSRMYQTGALSRPRHLCNDGCLVYPETQTIPDAHYNKTESKQSVQPDVRSGDRISGTCQDLSAADG